MFQSTVISIGNQLIIALWQVPAKLIGVSTINCPVEGAGE
jgi:hypothetical protein